MLYYLEYTYFVRYPTTIFVWKRRAEEHLTLTKLPQNYTIIPRVPLEESSKTVIAYERTVLINALECLEHNETYTCTCICELLNLIYRKLIITRVPRGNPVLY